MKKLKIFINSLRQMNNDSYLILKTALVVSSALLTASLLVLVGAGDFGRDTYHLYKIAKAFYDMPLAPLLISGICAACFQDTVS